MARFDSMHLALEKKPRRTFESSNAFSAQGLCHCCIPSSSRSKRVAGSKGKSSIWPKKTKTFNDSKQEEMDELNARLENELSQSRSYFYSRDQTE